MCHFVTAVLPAQALLPQAQKLARQHHRQLERISNASVEAVLQSGEQYFMTTRRSCDCGTTLGYLARANQPQRAGVDKEKIRKQLARKGWSSAKIERWMMQKERDAFSWQVQNTKSQDNLHWNQDWFDFIADLLNTGCTPYVGLLLHWYRGALSSRLSLQGRQIIRWQENGLEALAMMQEDVIYQFEGKAKYGRD